MDRHELLNRAAQLARRGEPFVLATVVQREAPSSARMGDRALVEGDGTFRGWLGGSCVEPVVCREALAAMRSGAPRLLVFTPGGEADRPGARVFPMHCHSGGTVEIFLEPELPAPVLALFGDSPVNRALALMGRAAGYRVRVVGAEDASAYPGSDVVERGAAASGRIPADGGDTGGDAGGSRAGDSAPVYAVVATMGEWDEDAVEEALETGAQYVGLVASPRRSEELRRDLGLGEEDEGSGAGPGEGRLVSPAGLDLGAREPAEIAVSILAEIVQRRRAGEGAAADDQGDAPGDGVGPAAAGSDEHAGGEQGPETATDPVCGMDVQVEGARHVEEHEETRYYFCSGGCRRSFEADPDRYVRDGPPE